MLTKEEREIIKATVPILRESGIQLTSHFYKRMFSHNPELKNIFNQGNQSTGQQQNALAQSVLAYAENIDNPAVLLPVVNRIGQKHTSLDIKPEQYEIVGRHLIASISELLNLQMDSDIVKAWKNAYDQLAEIFISVERSIYQKDISAGGWKGWKTFVVTNKVEESLEIASFYLSPEDSSSLPDYQPGQYISVKLFVKELDIFQSRQYSITNAPGNAFFRISVKKETGASDHPDGLISNLLHEEIKVGDQVEVSSPKGEFTLSAYGNQPLVFISGGVGQTPFIGMLEQLVNEKSSRKVVWIHGCRNAQVHAFKEHVTDLLSKLPGSSEYTFYDICEKPFCKFQGMVNLSKISDKVIVDTALNYICGPSSFIKKQYNDLLEYNIQSNNIFFEEFGPKVLQFEKSNVTIEEQV